ncbi:hypothetical protein DICSQDRAFT_69099, partial [Dichomitus squalens LYAD-421 SS1]
LRREDFSQVEPDANQELWDLIKSMMHAAPALRIGNLLADTHPVVVRARELLHNTIGRHTCSPPTPLTLYFIVSSPAWYRHMVFLYI